ncbi:MAG: FHIPEP family type III secretion protein [Nitrospirota bacterium]|nr:FHIPEP family type III secretion protein [Nitrospirota bacterium]
MLAKGQQPVILCSPTLRRHLRRLTERVLPSVPILALNEIEGATRVQALETVRAGEESA